MKASNLDTYIETKILEYKNKHSYDELIKIANTGEKSSDDVIVDGIPYLEHMYVLIEDREVGSLRLVATLWDMRENRKKSFKERVFWFIDKPDAQTDLIINRQHK